MIIKPPQSFNRIKLPKLFLGGSIEMGAAENWQKTMEKSLDSDGVCILNPRRDEWDASWEQSVSNPEFVAQVRWELAALKAADVAVLYFHPATKAPITLLELGLAVGKRSLTVCCPKGFWRKGNVDIVCQDNGVKQVNSLAELLQEARIGLYGK